MCVTGSDAWSSQKLMLDDRIDGAQSPSPKLRRVYPTGPEAATKGTAGFTPKPQIFGPIWREPFAYSPYRPIFLT